MRVVSTSVMTALVVVALFWGNCFSCPQMLAAFASHQPAHSCCHHKQPVKVQCQSQLLQHFVKAQDAGVAAMPAIAADRVTAAAASMLVEPAAAVTLVIEETPPDLLSLYSSFRI